MPSPNRRIFPLATTIAVLLHSFPAFAAEIDGPPPGATGLQGPARVAQPKLAPASNEWQKALAGFRVAPNFKIDLFAAEPMLGNPVAFDVDHQGRVFVAETYRYRTSTLDIRHYMFMLEDDLASRSTDDRIAYTKKDFPKDWEKLGVETEVVRLLEDRDGDGKADFSSEYAAGMNTLLDGINSGVLVHNGEVWCTNIPNLWRFSGLTPEGKAEKRESLSFGYGVRFSYTGHDMHGLIFGPDGRLYFSFGDRGAHVTTKEGKVLAFPDEGAVFRCEPDGSHMEVVARGLRNPQELAFDKYGNLFTGDNDSDQGDRERWVYVVDGADSGWRVGWQHNPLGKARNPWLADKLWQPHFDGQAAYILPPIANIPDGPSGLAYYPGTGLPTKYDDHFFLCGFKGSSARSAVSSWAVKPKGASFELVNEHVFIDNVQATDIAFGPDSKIYFSEWGEGWEGTGKGRIFRMWDPETIQAPQVEEVRKLLAEGFDQRPAEELGKLLSHPDQRIRLEAQWALAKTQGGSAQLAAAATGGSNLLARLHGIWGLGHLARLAEYQQAGAGQQALASVVPLLDDKDQEVRAQAAKVLGEGRVEKAYPRLLAALKDTAPRVRFLAALAVAKFERPDAVAPAIAMLRENNDQDQYLRHAGVMMLASSGDLAALQHAASDDSAAVRMASLLAMRRLESPEIARFLQDKEPRLVVEAARAINDVPILPALTQLGAVVEHPTNSEALMLRAINANLRDGKPQGATALATYAIRHDAPEGLRLEALEQLATWEKPFARDRIVGVYRPLQERDAAPAVAALHDVLPKLLADKSTAVRLAALEAVEELEAKEEGSALFALVSNPQAPAKVRGRALEILGAFGDPQIGKGVEIAIADKDANLRITAITLLGKLHPDEAAVKLGNAFKEATTSVKKVIITSFGDLKSAGADHALVGMIDELIAGKVPAEIQLELLDAAAKRTSPEVKAKLSAYQNSLRQDDPLAAFRPALVGGDRAAGEKLFKEHAVAQCLRCHKVGGQGGDAGPELSGIATRKDREYILESIINPNAKIAESFQMMLFTMKGGALQAGLIKSENNDEVVVQAPGLEPVKLKKSEIVSREMAPSGMPPGMDTLLTKREIRDIVEYVASLK